MISFEYQTTSKTILADLYTPVGVYMRLRDLYPQSALMECSDYHEQANARSFIGINPIASIAIGHGIATVNYPDGTTLRRELSDDFGSTEAIHTLIDSICVEGDDADVCGLFGYTSFNAVRYFENINVKDETLQKNDAPDVLYILFQTVIVFDHHNNQLKVVALQRSSGVQEYRSTDDSSADVTSELQNSRTPELQIDTVIKAMNRASVKAYDFRPVGEVTSPLTDEAHKANIRRGIQHCLRGDVFQIVLSRRFIQHYEGDDFKLYRALRSINPSPYLFYFDFGGFRIFGSSPETHCRIERLPDGEASGTAAGTSATVPSGSPLGGPKFRAYIDPIAGTTKRTGDAEADRRGAEFLRNDPKENAEHVMLVDLARNDLSRNCHGVRVDYYKDIQYYSHVIHLVSRVSGELDGPSESLGPDGKPLSSGADPIKAFIDTFPAGTLSGAPKVRAMQLISEYEPHNRGAYGGCIGIIGLDGSLNQAITIRTFVSRNGELWFQAGGGIVAKSNEEYELQEVNNKLGALRRAILMAEKM
ncbi:MAG: anthranilate synthase component I family protein [Prevotella sp.]|nr:anthranilate synthase component I family protein [Prevotella sp.]